MEASTGSAEWRNGWPIVLTAFAGFALPAVAIHSTGLMIEPLQQEFGWSRTQITAGASLAGLLSIPLAPVVGALIDRWGIRVLALPGTLLSGLALAGLSLANGSFAVWMALWTIYGLIVLSVKPTIWTSAISSAFLTRRSMALGVGISGTAFAGAITPPLTQWLADEYGWRMAYVCLAIAWSLPAFILSYVYLYGVHERKRAAAKPEDAIAAPLPGLSLTQAFRSPALVRIGLSTLILLALASGLTIHKVPLLTEAGISRSDAALLASLSGIAAIVGKLVTGWLMDRYDAGLVGGLTNAATAVALILLLEPVRTPALIVTSMIVVGYAGGTTLQICAFLTSVYAGPRNFGKIFGVMSSIIAVGGSLGPLLGGLAYDSRGNYSLLIAICIPSSLAAGLLLVRLGAFPAWHRPLSNA